MRNLLIWAGAILTVGLMALTLVFSPIAMAQDAQAQGGNVLYNKLNNGPGGPAPQRDLSGFWTGPIQAQPGDVPSMTPLGKQEFSANKPERRFNVKTTNDNFVKTCDPMGFPYNAIYEIRGLGFSSQVFSSKPVVSITNVLSPSQWPTEYP